MRLVILGPAALIAAAVFALTLRALRAPANG